MADEERRRSFPYVPASVWWELRRRFQRGLPGQVSVTYLQTVLGIQAGHAKNLMPQLKAVGLLAEDEKPTPLANTWRTDEGYVEAVQQMLRIYPAALLDAVPPSDPDRDAAQRWFMRVAGVGEKAAGRMAGFYVLLCEADPTGSERAGARSAPARSAPSRETRPTRAGRAPSPPAAPRDAETPSPGSSLAPSSREAGPSVHIDVQLHIPADASAAQIEAIFSAMAKHLYHRQ